MIKKLLKFIFGSKKKAADNLVERNGTIIWREKPRPKYFIGQRMLYEYPGHISDVVEISAIQKNRIDCTPIYFVYGNKFKGLFWCHENCLIDSMNFDEEKFHKYFVLAEDDKPRIGGFKLI